ncbi:uncharacterized protein LOC134260673 [Saccostrea cucullata]|uniref:uncharacterized protein LOC134260673 n=1 Tax=Saccostrea cuccullata TaxID=36930 RepID=UPI002ED56FCC
MKNTQLQTLQKHLDEINKKISYIKDKISSIDVAKESNNISKMFDNTINVDSYRNLPQKILTTSPKFTSGRIIEGELGNMFGTLSPSSLTSNKHGYSMKTTQKSPEAGSSPPLKHLLDEPQTVTTIGTGYGVFYSVACLSDEEILNCEYCKKNKKIKEVIRLQNWKPDGVCCTSLGDLLIIMNKYLDVCLSDCGVRAVVVVNQAGKLRLRYTGHTLSVLFYPHGITTDSQSHILTADNNNHCVHIIDQDGQFLRYIDDGLMYPRGLCTDRHDYLFVAKHGNRQMKKIKYLRRNHTPT